MLSYDNRRHRFSIDVDLLIASRLRERVRGEHRGKSRIAFRLAEWDSEPVLSDQSLVAFIPSTDLGRSRRFYESVLRLPVISQDGFAVVVAMRTGTIRITNVGYDLAVQPFTVLGWDVDDLNREVDVLLERGVQFLKVPDLPQDERAVWTAPDGTGVAWFKDPDGNTLSLHDRPA